MIYVLMGNWSGHPASYQPVGAYSSREDAEWANIANTKLVENYHGYIAEVEFNYKINEATVNKLEELGMTVPRHLQAT